MHPDRVIVRTYIRSDGISDRPDNPNTLTFQSAGTNDAARDPFHVPVTWNTAQTRPYSILRLLICLRLQSRHLCCRRDHHKNTTALRSRPLAHLIRRHKPRHQHRQFFLSPFPTRLDSIVFILLDSLVF